MSNLQQKYEEFKSIHGKEPTASQLARFAHVRYNVVTAFIHDVPGGGARGSNIKHKMSRSQTVSFIKTSPAAFSPPTKVRTSSFSKEIYQAPKQAANSSSGIDYSGSTTGANNPWKQFQRSKSSYSSSFSHSYSPKPKSKPKARPASPGSPTQSTTTTTMATTATATATAKYSPPKTVKTVAMKSPKTKIYNAPSSAINKAAQRPSQSQSSNTSVNMRDLNMLRADFHNLSKKYERECSNIRQQFDEIRNALSRKESDIITDLTNYTNECKRILQQNMSKMEQLSQNNNGSSKKVVERVDNTDHHPEEKQEKQAIVSTATRNVANNNVSAGIDYSGSTTGSNNPWGKKPQATYSTADTNAYVYKQETVPQQTSKPTQTSSKTTIKSFAAKTQRQVDNDEWSDPSEGSWN